MLKELRKRLKKKIKSKNNHSSTSKKINILLNTTSLSASNLSSSIKKKLNALSLLILVENSTSPSSIPIENNLLLVLSSTTPSLISEISRKQLKFYTDIDFELIDNNLIYYIENEIRRIYILFLLKKEIF